MMDKSDIFAAMKRTTTWTIADEKLYLKYLGMGVWSRYDLSRKALLIKYCQTIHLRDESWVKEAYKIAAQMLQDEFNISPPPPLKQTVGPLVMLRPLPLLSASRRLTDSC